MTGTDARLAASYAEGQGRLDEADRILAVAIATDPGAALLIDDLIRVSHRRGDMRRLGEALLARLRLSPERAELWNDLGVVFEQLGDPAQAMSAYRHGLVLDPVHASATKNAAMLHYRRNRYPEALAVARRGIAVGAFIAESLVVAAHARHQLGDIAYAAQGYRRALTLRPDDVSALEGLATATLRAKTNAGAIRLLRRARSMAETASVLANLSEALRDDSTVDAISVGRRAVALAPSSPVTINAVALAYGEAAEDRPAIAWSRRAVCVDPGDGMLQINLGIAYKAWSRFSEAQYWMRQGLKFRPHDSNARVALANSLFPAGKLREGFAEYEWRYTGTSSYYDVLPAPRWDGSPIGNGSLLVWGEQGVGDEIMFIQYLRRLGERVSTIVVECDPRLVSVFRRSFPDVEFVARTEAPAERLFAKDIVAQIALLSLPYAFDFDLDDLASSGAYLVPDDARRRQIEESLGPRDGRLRVAIAWRTRRQTPRMLRGHTRLTDWAPILRTPGVDFINVQYGGAEIEAEIDDACRRFGVAIRAVPGLDLFNDMEGLVALAPSIDLMMGTVTSAYCPLAAAGAETWHLLARYNYITFGASRDLTCPRSRGFYREPDESWERPVAEMADALRRRIAEAG